MPNFTVWLWPTVLQNREKISLNSSLHYLQFISQEVKPAYYKGEEGVLPSHLAIAEILILDFDPGKQDFSNCCFEI